MQTPVILVENLDRVCDFFKSSFGADSSVAQNQQPIPHHFLRLSDSVGLILIHSSANAGAILTSLKSVSVRRVIVSTADNAAIQTRALSNGGVVVETLHEGGSVIEGPEGILLYLVGKSVSLDEKAQILLQSMVSKKPIKGDDEVERSSSPLAVANPRPIIHTLNCKIMNITSPDRFAPCPPNMRAPVPFETGDIHTILK
jgi:hypothetical protein